MSESDKEMGVAVALLERHTKHRLPRALEIKERVDQGETLSDPDLDFLQEVLESSHEAKALADEHPELQEIYVKAVELYTHIMDKATENANQNPKQ